jgi:hypothetical protein
MNLMSAVIKRADFKWQIGRGNEALHIRQEMGFRLAC